ncbi:MAG TPA: beta-ketoacyl synthase [Chitinophagaceae bacterium]|nr:beta-ketoacyl synthase [Chitinophagaceae bacterium]
MRKVYVVADNIFSPLGKNTRTNMDRLKQGVSGILQHRSGLSPDPFYAALFSPSDKPADPSLTPFEYIVLASAREALQNAGLDPADQKTGFILSSTKGNISLIEDLPGESFPENRVSLNTSADIIAGRLGIITEPLVVSHACISGLLAMITGMRLIQSGQYENLIISGGDLITSFIYSGFRSFQAISPNPCKPFDAARDGISLGEAAATVILSADPQPGAIRISGGSVSNDANHISGPSRTGEELWLAIRRALQQAGTTAQEIDFISAHGTATRYNDEMEAKAIHLASMQTVPVNSLKGFYGHTLGAAGILESVVTIHSMKENIMIPTLGFTTPGTEMPVHIVNELKRATLHTCLKTASGFGGCNAAIVMVQGS